MLVSTEKRLGLIAASTLTVAALFLMSEQNNLAQYALNSVTQHAQMVQTLASAPLLDVR